MKGSTVLFAAAVALAACLYVVNVQAEEADVTEMLSNVDLALLEGSVDASDRSTSLLALENTLQLRQLRKTKKGSQRSKKQNKEKCKKGKRRKCKRSFEQKTKDTIAAQNKQRLRKNQNKRKNNGRKRKRKRKRKSKPNPEKKGTSHAKGKQKRGRKRKRKRKRNGKKSKNGRKRKRKRKRKNKNGRKRKRKRKRKGKQNNKKKNGQDQKTKSKKGKGKRQKKNQNSKAPKKNKKKSKKTPKKNKKKNKKAFQKKNKKKKKEKNKIPRKNKQKTKKTPRKQNPRPSPRKAPTPSSPSPTNGGSAPGGGGTGGDTGGNTGAGTGGNTGGNTGAGGNAGGDTGGDTGGNTGGNTGGDGDGSGDDPPKKKGLKAFRGHLKALLEKYAGVVEGGSDGKFAELFPNIEQTRKNVPGYTTCVDYVGRIVTMALQLTKKEFPNAKIKPHPTTRFFMKNTRKKLSGLTPGMFKLASHNGAKISDVSAIKDTTATPIDVAAKDSPRPKFGDIYMMAFAEHIKGANGKTKYWKGSFSHMGFVLNVVREPDQTVEKWTTSDGGQGSARQKREATSKTEKSFDSATDTFSKGVANQGSSNKPRVLHGWVDLDEVFHGE